MELWYLFSNTDEQEPKCLPWDLNLKKQPGHLQSPPINVKVINVTDVNHTYTFVRGLRSSCHLTSYIAYLDVTGNWTKFNLSANVFEVIKGDQDFYSDIKV